MNKKMGKILSIFALATTSFALAMTSLFSGVTLHALSATAETENQQTKTDELISPSSYEQYLELNKPSDVAVNDLYTAIADGNIIYVYDKTQETYREYAHKQYNETEQNLVSKLQFSDGGELFFLDGANILHQLSPERTALISSHNLGCVNFLISGNEIYFTKITQNAVGTSYVAKTSLDKLSLIDSQTLPNASGLNASISLANREQELFYTDSGKYLFRYFNRETDLICHFSQALTSMVVSDSLFLCTIDNQFLAYDYETLVREKSNAQPFFTADGEYGALSMHDGFVYAIDGNSVRQFSLEKKAFTSYEICSTSTEPNRLHGATDILYTENAEKRLLIADAQNQRITIREESGEYRTISTAKETDGNSTQLLASTENTVLIAERSYAHLYSLESETLIQTFDFSKNPITGVTGVYGKYYFTTSENNGYYVAQKTQIQSTDQNGEQIERWKLSSPITKGGTPNLLTSDVYGNLYVVRAGNVFKYTEKTFMEIPTGQETPLFALSVTPKKIAVDYGGNFYVLTQNAILRFEQNTWLKTSYSLENSPVYSKSIANPLAFTFGVEENQTYILYNGSFVTQTPRLNLPTLKTIPVNGADESIFSPESAEFSVVQTKENALLVQFTFDKLQSAEYFPYAHYERSSSPRTALKIGETADYYILAEFNETNNAYSTYLVKKDSCTPLAENDYSKKYDQTSGNERYGYLTNATHIYKFPYLTPILTIERLEKNTKIRLLGEITQLDHEYYHVEYQTESGVKTGYVPKVYVLDFDASTPETQTEILDGNPANQDSIWRLAYLLCGFAAIFILIDCLILRKKPKDD